MIKLTIPGELPGTNEIIDAAKLKAKKYQAYSQMKETYTDTVAWIAKGYGPFDRIDIIIIWVCKNQKRDKDNISGGIKFILDGLKKSGMIKNDGWKQIGDIAHKFDIDKNNPRIEILIIPITP